jgi:hypothetical protein
MSTETFLTTADVERIRADERRATVERLRERIIAVLETADRIGEVAALHPILERLDDWAEAER